jgi:hypothetical protein
MEINRIKKIKEYLTESSELCLTLKRITRRETPVKTVGDF